LQTPEITIEAFRFLVQERTGL